MIDIKAISSIKGKTYQLIVDGSTISFDGNISRDSLGVYWIYVREPELRERIFTHCFSDLSEPLMSMQFVYHFINAPAIIGSIFIDRKYKQFSIRLRLYFSFGRWKQQWSIAEYVKEFYLQLKSEGLSNISLSPKNPSPEPRKITLSFPVENAEIPMLEEISKRITTIQEYHEKTIASLTSKLRNNSVVINFDFPEEVRVPCEQYLLYFVQFLKDLGVEATAELQHEAGQVLFAVTPMDKQTALDKIRTALETYLQLSSNPINDSSIEYEIAAQRLAANIDHLKGQLRLAHAELRLAEATAQTQQVTINNLLSSQIIIDSMKNIKPKPQEEDKEELLDGTVALTKVNWKGVEVNLPEIFRRLRRLFNENE